MWTMLKTHLIKRKCYIIKAKVQKNIQKSSCRIYCRANSLECITQCRSWYTRFCSLANITIAIRSTSPDNSMPCKFAWQSCKVKVEFQKKRISQKGSSLKFQQYSKFLNFCLCKSNTLYVFSFYLPTQMYVVQIAILSELHLHKESLCLYKQAIAYASIQHLSLYSFIKQKKCVNVEFKFCF